MTTFLQTSVIQSSNLDGGLKLYHFGSADFSRSPRDIDLAIVYNPTSVDVNDVLAYRQRLKLDGLIELGLPLDICLLTEQEAGTNPFLEDECAVLING